MEEVCCIIDCECFQAKVPNGYGTSRNQFLVREIAYLRIDKNTIYEPKSYLFDLSKYKWQDLSPQDRVTITYQTTKIHGLSFYPRREESTMPIDDLHSVVRFIYEKCRIPDVAETIAFKGGHVERDILETLNLSNLNLQSYGCPKFKDLNEQGRDYDLTCGHHSTGRNIHCAKSEVAAFRDWLREELNYTSF